ncbi:hypothetical protein K3555_13660 [Leisingera sp. M527]|uniref:hypothetical protein n=1 Tax=Leisingera sp. M527 TaxID=2867014 RepID=UPI0021A50A45|nr:hypothetical protein [Leisingera sp. M527]UWQ31639.1 hypothetical protein K3555_13660 [Leisingera sp. M527]
MKTFALGLVYPAVLGTMMVLLFTHLAAAGMRALQQIPFLFGVLIFAFYSFGFIHSSRVTPYGRPVFLLDLFGSVLIFFCYYFLGIDSLTAPDRSENLSYRSFYVVLLFVVISPSVRRQLLPNSKLGPTKRDAISALAVLTVSGGITEQLGVSFFQFLQPHLVLAILFGCLTWYIVQISKEGIGS